MLAMLRNALRDGGIRFKSSKTGRKGFIPWAPELEMGVTALKACNQKQALTSDSRLASRSNDDKRTTRDILRKRKPCLFRHGIENIRKDYMKLYNIRSAHELYGHVLMFGETLPTAYIQE